MSEEPIPWEVKNGELISIKLGGKIFKIVCEEKKMADEKQTCICSMCKIEKPMSSFHKDGSSSTGHKRKCKQCVSVLDAERKKRRKIVVPTFDMELEKNKPFTVPNPVVKESDVFNKTTTNWSAFKIFKDKQKEE